MPTVLVQCVHHEAPDIGRIALIARVGFFMTDVTDNFRSGFSHSTVGLVQRIDYRHNLGQVGRPTWRTFGQIVFILAIGAA